MFFIRDKCYYWSNAFKYRKSVLLSCNDSVVIVTYRNLKDNGSCTLHFCWHQSNISSSDFLYRYFSTRGRWACAFVWKITSSCTLLVITRALNWILNCMNQHCFYYLTDLRYILKVIFVKKKKKERNAFTFPSQNGLTLYYLSSTTICIVHWA